MFNKSKIIKLISYAIIPILISLIFTIIGICSAGYLYYKSGFSIIIKIIPYIFIAIGAFLGGREFRKRKRGRGITDGLIFGIILSVITFIALFAINKTINPFFLIVILLQLIFSIIGGIEQANIKTVY